MNEFDEDKFLDSLINLTEEEATNKVNESDYYVRITQRDGKDYMITCDLRFDRINFHINNGLITEATIG
jgi:hypothetical protein